MQAKHPHIGQKKLENIMSIVLFSNTVNNFNKIGGKFTLNNFDDDDAAANNKFGARKDTCHRD